jgi:hypothetical protein
MMKRINESSYKPYQNQRCIEPLNCNPILRKATLHRIMAIINNAIELVWLMTVMLKVEVWLGSSRRRTLSCGDHCRWAQGGDAMIRLIALGIKAEAMVRLIAFGLW